MLFKIVDPNRHTKIYCMYSAVRPALFGNEYFSRAYNQLSTYNSCQSVKLSIYIACDLLVLDYASGFSLFSAFKKNIFCGNSPNKKNFQMSKRFKFFYFLYINRANKSKKFPRPCLYL